MIRRKICYGISRRQTLSWGWYWLAVALSSFIVLWGYRGLPLSCVRTCCTNNGSHFSRLWGNCEKFALYAHQTQAFFNSFRCLSRCSKLAQMQIRTGYTAIGLGNETCRALRSDLLLETSAILLRRCRSVRSFCEATNYYPSLFPLGILLPRTPKLPD